MKKTAFLILLLMLQQASAATLGGTAYEWSTLEPLEGVIVEINTTPKQSMVTKDSRYSFTVPPGSYTLSARYYVDTVLVYLADENVTIKQEGDFVLDLLMFENLEEDEYLFDSLELDLETAEMVPERDGAMPYYLIGAAIVLVSTFVALVLRSQRASRTSGKLPEDLSRIVSTIEKEGGRINQRELRNNTGLSEAKISMMVSDLEQRGVVEKFKKGRGNIIRLAK